MWKGFRKNINNKMSNLNKKGFFNLLPLIITYWWLILGIIIIILLYNFGQNYLNPKYCLTDTFENRAMIEAYEFKLSDVQKDENKICFRSNNQELVQQMYQNIQDKRLEKEFELQRIIAENRNKLLNKLLEPMYFYPILLFIVIIVIYSIKSKKGIY